MRKILYIGWFSLPESAAGIRVYQIAKLLRKAENEVSFLCLSQSALKEDDEIRYDEFKYIRKVQSQSKIANIANIMCGCIDFSVIKKTISAEKPNTVIIYNEKERLTKRVISYCHQRGISVGADVTEWYELSRAKKWDHIVAQNVDYRIRKMDKKLDYIISISPYLTDYYKSIGCKNVVEIPPIMDHVKATINPTGQNTRRLVYAGSPAQKDLILPFLDAVKEINKNQISIIADIVGLTKEQIGSILQMDNPEEKGIISYGYVPHEECVSVVEKADFSVLFRDNLRYAKAGFSTKLSESLSLGIPVLCNIVGGADEVIKDGFNGIKIKGYDVDSIINGIEKVLLLDKGTIDKLKQNALETANQLFIGDLYTEILADTVNIKK